MPDFTHLHVHTEYSLLDGLSKINELIARAKELKMKSLAITDHGVMYGAVKFFNAAIKEGVKPIIGCETYLTTASLNDKSVGIQKQTFHQLLLAKNDQGYKNLMKLTTIAHLEGYYYRPRIDLPTLAKYADGLVATSSCMQGIIPQLILHEQVNEALEKCRWFLQLFKKDFYLEFQRHQGVPELEKINKVLLDFSRQLGIPIVATNDSHYVYPDDAKAQDALLAIQTKTVLSDPKRLSMISSPDYYLKSYEEMNALFSETPDALKNTLEIAEKCNVTIPTGKWILPKFTLPENYSQPEKFLHDLAYQGFAKRYPDQPKVLTDRLDYELKIICDKGFATYFLIVQDFVNWAKQHQIRVGPGRGSVAGSLVAYSLRITSIDPIQHNIPFERFMNPERPSPPDIDLDFADDRRDEVIKYVSEKYGKDHVAQIITFGTMEARGAIRDIGRVLGMPYSDPDKIAKLIPVGFSIEEALVNVPELQEYYKDTRFKDLLVLAKKVEGTARHASTHAAGVVIGDKPLTEYTPLQMETKNERIMTQYDMYSLDCNVDQNAIGLLKMDFLGLRNLTILQNAINFVKVQTGHRVDMSELPLDNPAVYKLLGKGETIGIFQLESGGMRHVVKKLQPSRFSDITALVALYRPGPMDLIDDFISGKKNPKLIKYPHLDLKPVLAETYGIAVYQEQALEIAHVMAGYSLGEADILRRAIGKKKISIMNKEKSKFLSQSQKKGYTKIIAEKIWGYIEKFAGYGFNKAHATAYAMIAYQTAYMKANHPVEFMAALLSAESGNKEKIPLVIDEAKRMKIKVMPPDINISHFDFTIAQDKSIRFGLSAIKNVGEAAIEAIITARKANQFTSLTDFCRRVDQQKVNKRVLESLIQVGAFDAFGKRSRLLLGLESIRQGATDHQKITSSPQVALFSPQADAAQSVIDKLPEAEEFSKTDLLAFEKQLLGFYLTDHPLAEAMARIKGLVSHRIGELDADLHVNHTVTVGGVIKIVKKIITKKGNQEMAFVTLDDDTGTIELIVFPKIYAANKLVWQVDQPALVTGKVDFKNRLSLVVDSVNSKKSYTIRLRESSPKENLIKLNQLFQNHPGSDQIVIELTNKTIHLPNLVNYAAIADEVKNLV